MDIITNLPLTFFIQASKLNESLMFSGNKITSAVMPFFLVDGLQANCVASMDLILGEIISTWVIPRCHARHSPYFSLVAEIPQLLNFATAQSCACCISGVPTNLGPISSNNS